MSKVTKKELKKQLDGVQNRFAALVSNLKASGHICESTYAPFAHDYAKEQADYDELIVILDSKEPKLKQLDQSVFDGLDEKWQFAAVVADGRAFVFDTKPDLMSCEWDVCLYKTCRFIDHGYDTSNWQNSLIERDKVELTGSDLAMAILNSGNNVMCIVNDFDYDLITAHDGLHFITKDGAPYEKVIPINNQGEPLTQSDVGL